MLNYTIMLSSLIRLLNNRNPILITKVRWLAPKVEYKNIKNS